MLRRFMVFLTIDVLHVTKGMRDAKMKVWRQTAAMSMTLADNKSASSVRCLRPDARICGGEVSSRPPNCERVPIRVSLHQLPKCGKSREWLNRAILDTRTRLLLRIDE